MAESSYAQYAQKHDRQMVPAPDVAPAAPHIDVAPPRRREGAA